MPVPKKRHTRARRDMRRAPNDKMKVASVATCSRCGAPKMPHRVCRECGWYKDRQVIVTESVT